MIHIAILILLCVALSVVIFYSYRVTTKLILFEDYITNLRENFLVTQEKINSPELASAFEADDSSDSVGFTFRFIRQAINDLEDVIIVTDDSDNDRESEA